MSAATRRSNRFNIAVGSDRGFGNLMSGMVDEMRISRIVRYRDEFTPESFSRAFRRGARPPSTANGPELLFDQGFGDLFVIRNAGNVIATDVVGSVEYALAHLATPLVVVMGHEGCGAVSAALMSRAQRAREPFELRSVLRMIDPALTNLDKADHSKAAAVSAVEANALYGVGQLKRYRDDLDHPVDDRTFVGAIYEMATGKVRFLEATD